jgi:transposase-like protein
MTIDELVRRHVEATLEETRGNRTQAAKTLGVNLSTLYRWLERWNLHASVKHPRGFHPERPRCYLDNEIHVGLECRANIGRHKKVTVRVTDRMIREASGETLYLVKRLDGGKRLGPQYASDLFPLDLPASFPKPCRCGIVHTRDTWKDLPLAGEMPDEGVTLELRNCPCGSTLAIELPLPEPD